MCNEYVELIMKAVDQELSQEEEEKLVAHLKVCETCRLEYKAQMQIKSWLNEAEESELPEGFHERLMSEVKKEKRKKHWNWQIGGMAAACVIIGSAFFYQIDHLGLRNEADTTTDQYEVSKASMDQESAVAGRSADSPEMQKNAEGTATMGAVEDSMAQSDNIWHITCKDPEKLKQQAAEFLESKKITYASEMDGNQMIIYDRDVQETVYDWLSSQDVKVSKDASEGTADQLVLLFEPF